MAVIQYTQKEKDNLARLMRAEALGEGSLGMLMVGNVIVNRVLAECFTFGPLRTLDQVIFQKPGGFEGVDTPLFQQRPRTIDLHLAQRVINGERFNPASDSLWFYSTYDAFCKPTWFAQNLGGKYKNHCFYRPTPQDCPNVF